MLQSSIYCYSKELLKTIIIKTKEMCNMSRPIRFCEIEGCGKRRFGNGLCAKHYARAMRGKDPSAKSRKEPNDVLINGEVSEIIMRNVKYEEIGRAIVDTEDLPMLQEYHWSLGSDGYAYSHSKGYPNVKMHRLIAKTPEGKITDHINCNRLDNRKINLRHVTDSQNAQNMSAWLKGTKHSKYKGVSLLKNREYPLKKPWLAYIGASGKRKYLGYYATEEEAAHVYDKAAKELFGEFAKPNFTVTT